MKYIYFLTSFLMSSLYIRRLRADLCKLMLPSATLPEVLVQSFLFALWGLLNTIALFTNKVWFFLLFPFYIFLLRSVIVKILDTLLSKGRAGTSLFLILEEMLYSSPYNVVWVTGLFYRSFIIIIFYF